MSTKTKPVATVASLTSSQADLATTELRQGFDSASGLMNHNGSFESFGAPKEIKEGEGKWQLWIVTFDGWEEKAYLNGRLVHEQNNFLMIRPEGHITIGADGGGANCFMGYISSLLIMPKSMTQEDVTAYYEMTSQFDVPSLGDDDFEEIDPNSKFTQSPNMKPIFNKRSRLHSQPKQAILMRTH